MAEKGTRIVYLPGNHDIGLRAYSGETAFGIEICNEAIHTLPDGRRFLVIHGDIFENHDDSNPRLQRICGKIYESLMFVDAVCHIGRRWMRRPHWSLAASIKMKFPQIRRFVDRFSKEACRYARESGCDGVICGHLHYAEIRTIDHICYCNTGDWTETCSAISEDHLGYLQLVNWTGTRLASATANGIDYGSTIQTPGM